MPCDVPTGAERVVVRLKSESVRLPRWSSDGRSDDRVLRGRAAAGRVRDVDRRGRRRNRGDPRGVSGPRSGGSGLAWRPDGSEVAYAGFAGAGFGLLATRTDGGGSRRLTAVAFGVPDVAWSPDGATVVYTDLSRALYAVPAAGGTPTRLAEGSAFDPVFSPDGTRVAFAVYRGPVSGSELATIPFPTAPTSAC